MYTIKEAAARAGVSIPVLRAWQRRYGIVTPARTAAGYRLFDEDEVALVRAMRELVEAGWSPSTAAASLLRDGPNTAPPTYPNRGADRATTASPPASVTAGGSDEALDLVKTFIEAAASLEPDRVSAALDDMLARGSFERVASTLVLPALRGIGEAWAEGRLSVAAEHAASHAVLRRLASAFEAAGIPNSEEGSIVVGLPPGSRHELGALTFATAARRAGLPVLYLGADLPSEDWLTATASAAAAVIGVITADDAGAASKVVARLRRDRPGLVVALGGPAARGLPGALLLPEGLSASVDRIAEAVRAPAPGTSSLSG